MSVASSKVAWNPLTGVVTAIGLYFVTAIISSLLLSLGAAVLGVELTESYLTQFLYVLIIDALTLAAIIAFVRHYKQSLAVLGFGRPRFKHALIGLGLYPLYFVAFAATAILVQVFVPSLNTSQEQDLGFNNVTGFLPLLITFVSLVILPPLLEEITVRGLIFTSLRKQLDLPVATIITSVVFASAHLAAGGYIAAIDTFVLSIFLCVVRERTGSLWPGITLHALKNGIAFCAIYLSAEIGGLWNHVYWFVQRIVQ